MYGTQAGVVVTGCQSNSDAETRVGVADAAGIVASMITFVGKVAATPFVGMRAAIGKKIAGTDITLISATPFISRLARRRARVDVERTAITTTVRRVRIAVAIRFHSVAIPIVRFARAHRPNRIVRAMPIVVVIPRVLFRRRGAVIWSAKPEYARACAKAVAMVVEAVAGE